MSARRPAYHHNLLSIKAIALTALMLACALISRGETIPYHVSDNVYKQYIATMGKLDTSICVHIADSISRELGKRGDIAGECLMMSIPVRYYGHHGDEAKMHAVCERLRKTAMRGDEATEPWYFWASHQEALHQMSNSKYFEAMETASKMHDEATMRNNDFGIYTTMILIGDIYRMRNDTGLAGENYLRAYDYLQKHLPDVNPAQVCAHLGEYYRRKSGRTQDDINKSKEFVDLGLSCVEDEHVRAQLLNERAMSLYAEHNIPAFNEIYRQCDTLYNLTGHDPEFLQIRYRKCILDKDYKRAIAMADSMPNDYDRQIALYVIQKAQGNYDAALRNYERATHLLNVIREQERRGDLAEMNARMGNFQLEIANKELERGRTQAERDRSKAINIALILTVIVVVTILIGLMLFNRRIKRANNELQQRNEELKIAHRKAEESDRMKVLFIQSMSHEIRTPLNAIVGFSSLLTYPDEEYTDEELKEFRTLINQNCEMLTALVDDILTISDMDSGNYRLCLRDTDINKIASNALEALRPRLKPGVEMAYTTSINEGHIIKTDAMRITHVINNLLINACKYTTVGHINLNASIINNGNTLQLTVTDTGPGIPIDKQYEIFERFTKLNTFNQGTGLGLSICKMIATQFNGRIYLDTSYVLGARFVFEVPITSAYQ